MVRLTVLFGIITIISLFITAIFGIAFRRFGKPVFKLHRFFAYLTLLLAITHATLVIFGIFSF